MRDNAWLRLAPCAAVLGLLVSYSSIALAQAEPAPAAAPAPAPAPAAAPAAAQPPVATLPPPPPGYQYQAVYSAYPPPPPGYAYAYPPPPRRVPDTVPYNGGPVPTGYHVEERARRGPTIAGPIVLASSYALGLTVASFGNFPNSTGWLAVPVLGPWLTLGTRRQTQSCFDGCVADDENASTRTFLVLDGLAQATGAALLIYGLASPSKVLARDFVGRLQFIPAQVGRHGYGGFLSGTF